MIRNVVMVKLRSDHDPARADLVRSQLGELDCPGTLAYTIGPDAGLRDGNWSFAIVADFVDADAYRVYDADEAHNRVRAELTPMVEQIARVQFEL